MFKKYIGSFLFLVILFQTSLIYGFTGNYDDIVSRMTEIMEAHEAYEEDPTVCNQVLVMNTFTSDPSQKPYVIYAPTWMGGYGNVRNESSPAFAQSVNRFYKEYQTCIYPYVPINDWNLTILGAHYDVENFVISFEFYVSFNHTARVDFLLPDVHPTGKHIEFYSTLDFALVLDSSQSSGFSVLGEIYNWDAESVFVQAGVRNRVYQPLNRPQLRMLDLSDTTRPFYYPGHFPWVYTGNN